MSVTQPDQSLDSGQNQLKPFLIAALIVAVTVIVTLGITGLPH